jgi:hypothetical protein
MSFGIDNRCIGPTTIERGDPAVVARAASLVIRSGWSAASRQLGREVVATVVGKCCGVRSTGSSCDFAHSHDSVRADDEVMSTPAMRLTTRHR